MMKKENHIQSTDQRKRDTSYPLNLFYYNIDKAKVRVCDVMCIGC